MEQYISKSTLVAEIEKQRQLIFPKNTGEMKVADVPKPLEQGWLNALSWIKKTIDTLEVKEVDLKKEYKDFVEEDPVYNKLVNDVVGKSIAKHFLELGLKIQKGDNK